MTQSIGPPSLAQGTRIAVGFSTSISRFIPACGELSKPSWAIVQLDGSSPLARGTHWRHYEFRFRCSVHPRLRGELLAAITGVSAAIGSSPLTRGTQAQPHIRADLTRFIPAYAGNSLKDGINLSIHTLGI